MSKVKEDLPSKRNFWPQDLEMPAEYLPSRRIYPCPSCKRVRLDDGGQNTIIKARDEKNVFMTCKTCNFKWSLPKNHYVFPKTKKKCTECGCLTDQYATKGNVQYRKCMNGTCNKTYTVIGKEVTY